MRGILERAGERAADSPAAWLAIEPAGAQADVHLTLWPGGERQLVAQFGYGAK